MGLLNNLSGSLLIKGLEHMRGNIREVESKNLLGKQYLQELRLFWLGSHEKMKKDVLEDATYKDKMVLETLQSHPSIKGLDIHGFCGRSLSNGICNLSSLQLLHIGRCSNLESLPKGMLNLKNLKILGIDSCP